MPRPAPATTSAPCVYCAITLPPCDIGVPSTALVFQAGKGGSNAIASVRPPFPLGYKVTGDYWKYFSLPQ